MKDDIFNRQKQSELINKVADEVMERIKIRIMSDTSVIDELVKKINNLGK